jgi:hypothetical protein
MTAAVTGSSSSSSTSQSSTVHSWPSCAPEWRRPVQSLNRVRVLILQDCASAYGEVCVAGTAAAGAAPS